MCTCKNNLLQVATLSKQIIIGRFIHYITLTKSFDWQISTKSVSIRCKTKTKSVCVQGVPNRNNLIKVVIFFCPMTPLNLRHPVIYLKYRNIDWYTIFYLSVVSFCKSHVRECLNKSWFIFLMKKIITCMLFDF